MTTIDDGTPVGPERGRPPEPPGAAPGPDAGRRGRVAPVVTRLRVGLPTFLLLLALGATWALATPLFAGPDEPSHVRKAAAAVRGQLTDRRDEPGGPAAVELPAVFRNGPECFAADPTATADCLVVVDPGGDLRMGHLATDYPPTYYLVVGPSTLLADGEAALVLPRLAGAAAMAALLALAVTAIAQQPAPPTAVTGLAVALTPIGAFLLGVVNPSGMAVAAGMAAWAGGYHLARTAPLDRLGGPVAAAVGPLCLLVLLRRDSLLWGALLVIAVAALVPRRRLGPLVRSPAVWAGAAATALALLVQGVLIAGGTAERYTSGNDGRPDPTLSVAWLGRTLGRVVQQLVGVLGWQDTELPLVVHVAVAAVVVALVALALVRAPRQPALVALGVLAAVLGTWVVLDLVRPLYVQGRYALPFAAGVPLVAAMGLAEGPRPLGRRLVAAVLAVATAVQIVAFWTNLRRYAVGADGPWWFLADPAWSPSAAPAAVLIAANAAAAVGLAVHWARLRPWTTR